MLTDTSGPAAGSCGAWSGERRPSARPAVGHDPPPALRAAASASAARSAASCSSSSPGTPSPATRTAPNQQKMRDMGELRGPWRAAAGRARLCRPSRGSSAPRAASPTGSPAVSPSKPPFSCTSPSPRRARTAGAWPRRAARLSVLGARAGPSPPWAPRRRRPRPPPAPAAPGTTCARLWPSGGWPASASRGICVGASRRWAPLGRPAAARRTRRRDRSWPRRRRCRQPSQRRQRRMALARAGMWDGVVGGRRTKAARTRTPTRRPTAARARPPPPALGRGADACSQALRRPPGPAAPAPTLTPTAALLMAPLGSGAPAPEAGRGLPPYAHRRPH